MTLEEKITQIRNVITELETVAENITVQMAQSGLTIVKDRSIRDGIFMDGIEGNFAEYSINKLLTVRLIGKELNQAGRDFIKKNRLATWHEFRTAQGLSNELVNLSYTNRMWTSINILSTVNSGGKVVVTIGSVDSEVQEYIGYLAERYGNFLRPTFDEQQDLIRDAAKEITDFLSARL